MKRKGTSAYGILWHLVVFILIMLTVSCGVDEKPEGVFPEDIDPPIEVADGDVIYGELDKNDGFKEGESFEETVVVRNCDNKLPRADRLTEARAIERGDEVSIVGTIGAEVGSPMIAAASASIAAGYATEIKQAMSRGRELELPVDSYSSVGYVIEWKPQIWSGNIPFTSASEEGIIEYTYTKVEFGAVKDIFDRTEEDCGPPDATAESTAETSVPTSAPAVTDQPAATDEPAPTDVPAATFTPLPEDTATPSPTVSPSPMAAAPANTEPGSELAVGGTWVQDGVLLTLESVDSLDDHQHYFWLIVDNQTGQEIVFDPDEASTEIINQNYGYEDGRHSYQPPYPPNRLGPGESKRFNVFFNTAFGFNPFSSEVDYYFIRFDNFSRIEDAMWRIDVQH